MFAILDRGLTASYDFTKAKFAILGVEANNKGGHLPGSTRDDIITHNMQELLPRELYHAISSREKAIFLFGVNADSQNQGGP